MNRAISLLLLRLLVFSAAALLGLGLVAPCMTIVPGFGDMETWVRLLKPQLMHASTYSVLSGIFAMIHNHNVGLGLLLLSFSAIFPTLKLATMAWSIEDLAARRPTGVLLRFAHHAGKFSMLDVLVLALLVIAIKGLPGNSQVQLGWGVWCFAGSVVLSLIASMLLQSAERRWEAE